MEKRIMTTEDMEILRQLIEEIDAIKSISAKVAACNYAPFEGNSFSPVGAAKKKRLKTEMLSATWFLRDKNAETLEDLLVVVRQYMAAIPEETVLYFSEFQMDELYPRLFYNEVAPFEAEPFIDALSKIINETFRGGRFCAASYDLNSFEISFDEEETAEAFMGMITMPFTLFEDLTPAHIAESAPYRKWQEIYSV